LQLAKDVRRPVSLSKQLIGNVILYIGRESAVCTALINNYYDPDIGARSLEAAVKGKVEASLVREYLAVNERIDESQPVEEYVIDLDQHGQIKVEMRSSEGRAPA
jgi:ATP-dependent Clp protease ATP-binding subunit ClpA